MENRMGGIAMSQEMKSIHPDAAPSGGNEKTGAVKTSPAGSFRP